LIEQLQPHQAIALGRLRPGLPDQVEVVSKRKLNGGDHANLIARTEDYLLYQTGEPALALIDYDTKGMPPRVAAKVDELGGLRWRQRPSEQRRRPRREKEKGLLTAGWKAEQEKFSELPLYEGLADAFDLADPDLWRSNTFASLRPRLISYVEHAIAVLEFQSGSRYGSIFLAPREAERRLQRAREILQLLKPEDRR